MRIYLLVALAQYEEAIVQTFGSWLLALSVRPASERHDFQQAGPLDAYYIRAEHVLNAAIPLPALWTPVNLWRTADFDAPAAFPVVMYEGVEPPVLAVPHDVRNGAKQGQLSEKWYETPENWSEGQKRLLKIMIEHPEKIDLGIGKLCKEAGIGTQAVGAVKDAVRSDKRLLNGLGAKILGVQS